MTPTEFLLTVWPRRQGYVFVAAMTPSGDWTHRGLPPSGRERRLDEFLDEHLERDNCFFCPHPFSEPRRKRELALPTRYLHCDIDAGDVDAFEPQPSVLLRTSPGKTQGLWLLTEPVSVDDAEDYNHALAQLGDANGWSITKYLRIPGSTNLKAKYNRPRVRLDSVDWTPITDRPGKMHNRPSRLTQGDAAPLAGNVDPDKHDPDEVIRRYRIIGSRKYRRTAGNRSGALCWLFYRLSDAGATPDEIASVLWHSESGSKYKEKRGLDDLQAEIERLGRKRQ